MDRVETIEYMVTISRQIQWCPLAVLNYDVYLFAKNQMHLQMYCLYKIRFLSYQNHMISAY